MYKYAYIMHICQDFFELTVGLTFGLGSSNSFNNNTILLLDDMSYMTYTIFDDTG